MSSLDINYQINIRYDGLDSTNGEIEVFALGESLKGIGRIAATVGNFAVTKEYSRYFSSHEVKVLARSPKNNCFSIDIVWAFVKQYQLLSGSFSAIIAIIIPYIFAKTSERYKEMKLLQKSLETAIKQIGVKEEKYIMRLLDIVETMTGDLKPSVKSAVQPIGKTCDTITIKSDLRQDTYILDDKNIICKDKDNDITESREFHILISELDLVNKTCKIELPDIDKRIKGVITDPVLSIPNNLYTTALASKDRITIIAKAEIKEGELIKLFISDFINNA